MRGFSADPAPILGRSVDRFTVMTLPSNYPASMAAKYYTHFVTAGATPPRSGSAGSDSVSSESSEWSGVVELRHPLEGSASTRELRTLLAESFDLNTEDIRILHWARLH